MQTRSWDEVRAFFAHDGVGLKVVSRSNLSRNCFDGTVAAVEVESERVVFVLRPASVLLLPLECGTTPPTTNVVALWIGGGDFRVSLPMSLTFSWNGVLHATEKVDGSLTNISFFPPVSPVS